MICREVYNLLPDYSAEALPRRQMSRLRAHLDACEACRRELSRLAATLRLVEEVGAVTPPLGIWDGVRRQIEEEEAARARPGARWWLPFGGWPVPGWRLASGMAAAAGLAVALWVSRGPVTQPHPAPVQLSDPELIAAVQQHSLASTGQLFADRAGLESVVLLVQRNREIR